MTPYLKGMSASDALIISSPKWLKLTPEFSAWCGGIGEEIELLHGDYAEAVRQGILTKCSSDAIESIGRSQGLPKLSTETYAQYRDRLSGFIGVRDLLGTDAGLIETLRLFGCTAVVFRVRYEKNNAEYVTKTDGSFRRMSSTVVHSDTNDGLLNGLWRWNRIWIVVTAHPWTVKYATWGAMSSAFSTVNSYIATGETSGLNLKHTDATALCQAITNCLTPHVEAELIICNGKLWSQSQMDGSTFPATYNNSTWRFSLRGSP